MTFRESALHRPPCRQLLRPLFGFRVPAGVLPVRALSSFHAR